MPSSRRRAGEFAIVAGLGALAVAWIAEHMLSMAPCALCLLERWPYRALVLLGLLGVAAPPLAGVAVWLIGAALCGAIVLSLTHVGVEQGWWPDPWPACMAPHFHGGSFAERLASMPLRPVKPCDAPSRLFNFLPVSMSSLDLAYAAAISVVMIMIVRSRRAR